ncbi:MAG: serine/threonine protein kinase, partial [Candidatus Riflebacteria bacterium]|nr:serine/threonine protein kinase [Candidatus Riflebacteria bacterium]
GFIERLSPEFGGRYRLVREIGRGGFGVVFLGTDLGLSRPVAIKFLLEARGAATAARRFEREAQALARFTHPNLVRIFDLGVDEDTPFMVFEYVEGQSLEDLVEKGGPQSSSTVERLAVALLDGLEALHDQGIVHRDLKPANVLVGAAGPKIIDLGMAMMADALESLTRTGRAVGTPSFMAPEQIAASSEVGPAADLYGLGGTLFHCLTARDPFLGSAVQIIAAKMKVDAPAVSSVASVPEPLATLVDRMLARKADAASPAPSEQSLRHRWWHTWSSRTLLTAVVAAVLVATVHHRSIRAVTVSSPAVERGLRSVTVAFRRQPSGPAQVRVGVDGRWWTVRSGREGVEHRIRLADLPSGPQITVQPRADDVAGPTALFRFQRFAAGGLALSHLDRTLEVGFHTPIPVRSRLRFSARQGATWSPLDHTPTVDHRYSIPVTGWLAPRFTVEHRLNDEILEEQPALTDQARLVYLRASAQESCRLWGRLVERLWQGAGRIERQYHGTFPETMVELKKLTATLANELPPPAFYDDVGGKDGVLGDPRLSPAERAQFACSIGPMEDLDTALGFLGPPASIPYERLFAPHFGPSSRPHYRGARPCPIKLDLIDPKQPFRMRSGDSHPPEWYDLLEGSVVLPKLGPASRVEIHCRARLCRGKRILVRINGSFEVQMPRPDRAFPEKTPADVYMAFDPAFLREGVNRMEFRLPVLPAVLTETMGDQLADVEIVSPGFVLLVQN